MPRRESPSASPIETVVFPSPEEVGLIAVTKISFAVLFIGVITFVLSAIGVKIGNVFGAKFKSKAELAGGIILILMGAKILIEHLEIIEKISALIK